MIIDSVLCPMRYWVISGPDFGSEPLSRLVCQAAQAGHQDLIYNSAWLCGIDVLLTVVDMLGFVHVCSDHGDRLRPWQRTRQGQPLPLEFLVSAKHGRAHGKNIFCACTASEPELLDVGRYLHVQLLQLELLFVRPARRCLRRLFLFLMAT